MTFTDVDGNVLAIGDIVYMAANGSKGKTSTLVKRMVVGFTPKMIKVDHIDRALRATKWDSSSLRYPTAVLKAQGLDNITYEYGVGNIHYDHGLPHRDGMTFEEATGWIEEFAEMSAPGNTIREAFYVIRRAQSEWTRV